MAETRASISPVNPGVISDATSDLGLSEESNGSVSVASVDVSSDTGISSTEVTEEMFEIEQQLEDESEAQEKKLREEALKKAEENKENCYKRLQHLLGRSSIYAQFLVRQMEKQDAKKARQENQSSQKQQLVNGQSSGTSNKRSTDECSTATSGSSGKRSLNGTSKNVKRRRKEEEVQLSEIFDKEDINAQANKGNGSADDAEKPAVVPDTYSRTIKGERVSDLQPNLFTGGVMRDYQIEALEWLKVLYENGVNGILGDEMGLGKTIECISLVAHLVEMGVGGPYLVIGPLSTLCNWVNEFKRFTPEIPVMLYHGSQDERALLRKKIYRKVRVKNKPICPVVVTSYSLVMRDKKYLMDYPWIIIVDEGHRIKNWQCQLVRDLKKYRSTNRLLLTGTPLQNNLSELWSLLNFLLPEVFDDLQVFESWFDITALSQQNTADEIITQEQEKQIISTIHQILSPFLLRRTKADVNLKLPPKKELIVFAPISEKQRELYNAVANNTIRDLLNPTKDEIVSTKRHTEKIDYGVYFGGQANMEKYVESLNEQKNKLNIIPEKSGPSSIVHITSNAYLVMMRKICNHPYLVEFPLDPETNDYLIDENMVKICGKLQILDLMLPELQKRGHKVLIFSQFVVMLDILDFYCEMRGYPYHRLQGNVRLDERQRLIDDFNENPSSFLFLISTRAGGLGINLTKADTVIIYDSDWNPQNDLQAQDRCHRFGQTKPVVVYRLVTANTAEQKIVERACAKRKLEKMIIRKGQFSSSDHVKSNKVITAEELLEILHEKDHTGTLDMQDVISRENLNALLDRSDMLGSLQDGNLSQRKGETTNPTEIKGVFKLVEQVDFCGFSGNV